MIESFEGHTPEIDPAAFVHESAVLIGQVSIGAQSSVWPQVTLRADDGPIRIGEKTSIQDGTTIHMTEGLSKTTVGDRVTVGHNVILHGCTIKDNSLIGMGATVLNGAVIGSNCIVGANALIGEGKEIPDNSLVVGVPGKIVRTLPAEAAENIRKSAEGYVRNWRRYKAGLAGT